MVFLPLYPALIKLFSLVVGDFQISSIVVSNLFFILAGIFFYKLLREKYTQKFSAFVVMLMAIFPTSYFFSSSYPESLFVFLFCLSFISVKKHPLLSGVFSGLSYLARPFGIILLPSLIVEFIKSKKGHSYIIALVAIFITFVSTYLFINYAVFNDLFAFQKILENHWQKSFTLPWLGIIQSWRVAILSNTWDEYRIFVGLSEAVASTIAWIFVPLAFLKRFKIKTSWAIYYTLGVILFTSTGFILSAPRYILSLPPFFVILASVLKGKVAKITWIAVSTALLIYLTTISTQGRWAF